MDNDKQLYNEFLNGQEKSFEMLYLKYKDKIKFFIYNIVKDYEKAEDLTQDVFVYILHNKVRSEGNFKYYIYLVAKIKAINYKNTEKRRGQIVEKYFTKEEEEETDTLEILTRQDENKKILEAINSLDEIYKNAMYLVKIEGFSYKQTSQILGTSISNVKNLIHRGKKELRKILIKKGFGEMNKTTKIIIILICTIIAVSGVVIATTQIYKLFNKNHRMTMKPSYHSTLDETTINNLWIGTLELAWKELEEKIGKKIELEESTKIADELNQSTFSKEMLSQDDYEINVSRTVSGGYNIDTRLKKNLKFLHVFDNFTNDYNYTFGDDKENIKYFGINNATLEKVNENVEVLFYNQISNNAVDNDFAVKLKTQEGDEIILYRTEDKKSFDEYYEDIQIKNKEYSGERIFQKGDQLLVPYIRVNGEICYNELFGKVIKNTKGMYIANVVQNVNFSLNESGCNLSSTATMTTEYLSAGNRYFWFKDTFIVFMKEQNALKPYFALKVDNSDILEKKEETDEPKIIDRTVIEPERYNLEQGEYKFFEDEKFEYYYSTHKTKLVTVYFKNGDFFTVEEALKDGKITMELLDKYGVKYIKKKK